MPGRRATLVRPWAAKSTETREACRTKSPANEALLRLSADPLFTGDSAQTTQNRYVQGFSSPLTDSNRRPPPYHEREEGADPCGIPCRGAGSRVSGSSARRRVLRRRATLVRPPPGGAILLPGQMLGSLGTWRFGGWTTSESSLTALRAMTLVFRLSLPRESTLHRNRRGLKMSNARTGDRILGSLGSAEGMGVVRLEDRLDTDADQVWSALTEPARLAVWYGEVDGDLRVGGEYQARLFASGWEGTGRIEACDPPKRLLVVTKDADASEEQEIEITLTADGDGTVLVWEERGMPVDLAAAYGAAVQVHVEDLVAYLGGRDRCDASARFEQLFPTYQGLSARVS
jgi:uncharacterized protein YndB with AHSA1/START domain